MTPTTIEKLKEKCCCVMSGYAQTTNYCPVHKDLPMTTTKCKTCVGYGLWAIGDPSPMGPMDSRGMPSIPCPECGAVGSVPIYLHKKK